MILRYLPVLFAFVLMATAPGTPEFFFNQGVNNMQTGDFEAAEEDFSRAIEIADDLTDAYYNRGYVRIQTGDLEGAASDFENIYKKEPTNIEVIIALGNVYEQLGKVDEAIELYTEGLLIEPENPRLYKGRGLAHFSYGNYEKAIEDFTKSIQFDATDPNTFSNRASSKYNTGDVEGAIEDFEKALQIRPGHPAATQNLKMIRESLQEAQKQEENNKQEVDSTTVYRNQAGNAYNQGLIADAIRLSSRAIAIDPTYIEAYIIRGSSFLAQPTYSKAIADFAAAAKLGSQNPYVYYGMGIAQYKLENYDKSISALDRGLEIDSDNADMYLIRGQAHADKKQIESAISDFTKAVKYDPAQSKAYHYLGNLYMARKNVDKAVDNYENALKLEPENPIFLSNMATAYIAKYHQTGIEAILKKARSNAQKAYDKTEGTLGLYALASSEALENDLDPAFEHLRELLEKGIETPERIKTDYNWEHLFDNEEFKEIVGQ